MEKDSLAAEAASPSLCGLCAELVVAGMDDTLVGAM